MYLVGVVSLLILLFVRNNVVVMVGKMRFVVKILWVGELVGWVCDGGLVGVED